MLFRFTELDLVICRQFFDGDSQTWPMFHDQPWIFLFYYGVYLPLFVGIAGAALAVIGPWYPKTRRFTKAGVFLGLSILLGPGLIINGVLKPTWGRPRPTNCIEFGGDRAYQPLGIYQGEAVDRSFPSGHASIGFFLAVPALLLIHRHRRWAMAIFAMGITYGGVMGLGRVVQGRHFPSDIIWSLAITYFSALLLLYLLKLHRPPQESADAPSRFAPMEADETGRQPSNLNLMLEAERPLKWGPVRRAA